MILGELAFAGEAGEVEVSSGAGGAAVSTLNERVAVLWLPAASVTRTRKVWAPSESELEGVSEAAPEQGAKLAVPVSIEHSKLEPPSEEWKVKVGVGLLVRPAGPESIVATGGVVSIVQLKAAGLWSVLPAWSVARTSNL